MAVRKSPIRGSILRSVLLLGTLVVVPIGGGGCDEAFRELGDAIVSTTTQFPLHRLEGPICGQDSCCSPKLEYQMLMDTKHSVDQFLLDSLTKLSQLIDVRARRFDEFFREMMNNSKVEFDTMFRKIYGIIYVENSEVFSDFFDELNAYYRRGTVRLTDTIQGFFNILYERMFTVLNRQYQFDDKYVECVSEQMSEMKPFGDVPEKLTMQLRRSFVATRTYYKSLTSCVTVVDRMRHVKLTDECLRSMTRMQQCGKCKGRHRLGACSQYCAGVLEDCLRHFTALNPYWDHLIDSLDKVAERLLGPFNIEIVVESLNTKISEAIMNFQDSGTDISKRIFSKCGTPTLRRDRQDQIMVRYRRKRRAAPKNRRIEKKLPQDPDDNPQYEIQYEPIKLLAGKKRKKGKKTYTDPEQTSALEKLIKSIKMKVGESRQYWLHLPYQYCNNGTITAPPSDTVNCWNGTTTFSKRRFPPNPSPPLPPAVLKEQIVVLEVLTDKLRKAHQGDEVDFLDDDEDSILLSHHDGGDDFDGSGSGDGTTEGGDETFSTSTISVNTVNRIAEMVPSSAPPTTSPPSSSTTTTTTPTPTTTTTTMTTRRTTTAPPPEVVDVSGTSSAVSGHLVTVKALAQYLVPIVFVWFGGTISDLL